MAQDVVIGGAIYNGVEQVDIPLASGAGKASFFLNGGSAFVPYNVNLLDNADWFAYVINQRGNTTYNLGGQYGFDRWQIYNAAAIVDGAVQMGAYCTLQQKMEIPRKVLIDRDYTVAIDIDGSVYSKHVNLTSAGVSTSIGGVDVTFGFLSGEYVMCGKTETYCPYITFDNNSDTVINVRRVWLELGSVCHMETTPPKSYADTLTRCQRYFVVYTGITRYSRAASVQPNVIQMDLPFSAPMRTIPQIVQLAGYNMAVYKIPGNAQQSGFSFSVQSGAPYVSGRISCNKTAHGCDDALVALIGVALSAEL